MRKTIKKVLTLLIVGLILFGAVFGLWLFFEGFDNTIVSQWLYQCNDDWALLVRAIICTAILVLSSACLTTSILMPYYYEDINRFVDNFVDKWFPRKQNDTKEEPKIQVTLIKSNPVPKVVVKDMVIQPTITDLEHVSEVIADGASDKIPKINNIVSGKHFVDNFDEYFPMSTDNFYTWTYAIEKDCERIRKSMLKDDKTAYFYEKNQKGRENLLLGIQTTLGKWRITKDKNANTKWSDYCIYDYVEDKHYLLIDPVEVSMELKEKDWQNYISLYIELDVLFDCLYSDNN